MATTEKMDASLDLRGLDLTTPVDLLTKGRTPFAKNFRLYAQQSDDRRVAVSSRKGPGFYVNPLTETLSTSNVSTTGASTVDVAITDNVQAIKHIATDNSQISRVDLNVQNIHGATGPVMVQIYSDKDGVPSDLLSESSILNGQISSTLGYATARFINPVTVVNGTSYWIVISLQDDAVNTYTLSTTTDGAKTYSTDGGLSGIIQQTYSINYKVWYSPFTQDKGSYRFNRDNGDNVTVVAYNDTMYRIRESDHTLVPIISGLNTSAKDYSFSNADNKIFWVNGYDDLTAWNGGSELTNPNLVSNGSFDTNTSGWVIDDSEVISRDTTTFHSAPASMKVTSGFAEVDYNINLDRNKRYKVVYWVYPLTAGTVTFEMYNVAGVGNTGTIAANSSAVTAGSWQKMEFYITPLDQDVKRIKVSGANFDYYLDDVSIVETGIEYIRDPDLPILSQIEFHKDRAWGVTAADPNKLVFSENPGNPAYDATGTIPTAANQQWYYAWLSVSFIYVPRPHNGSPITGIESFQDSLTVFTQDKKYVISGSDRGSFNLREATGSKGALSSRGITKDENNIFFVSADGFYSYNGSSDEKLSALINPLFDGCGQKGLISPVLWNNEVRFYMASQGSAVNDTCIIYNKDLQELEYDTGTYVNRAIYYGDADDQGQLIEFSSKYAISYLAEQDYNSLGAPIDFEYRLKYESMGVPGQRKRIKRYFPLLQGVDSTFLIGLYMDKDFEDSPKIKETLLSTNGSTWGGFNWGDGTLYGGDKSFKQHRQSYSGYAYYWQLRVVRKGVNNRVAFIGSQYSYKTKRL